MKRDVAQSEGAEELVRKGDHLDIEHRIIDTEYLDSDLIELPVPPVLSLFVPEVRPGVPHLPRGYRMMLNVRPTRTGRLLGTQRDVAAALVDEVVHLLRHDIGGISQTKKDTQILEHRQDDLLESGPLDDAGERVDKGPPSCGVGSQDVARTRRRLELWHARRLVVAAPVAVAICVVDTVRIEHGIDVLHGPQHRLEVTRVGEFELETHASDPVGSGQR